MARSPGDPVRGLGFEACRVYRASDLKLYGLGLLGIGFGRAPHAHRH